MKTGGKGLSKIKLFIFDLDGTLVDAYPAIYASLNFTLEKLGLKKVGFTRIKKAVGKGDRKFIQEFFPSELEDKALRIYRKRHREDLLKYAKPMSYAKLLLRYLKSKGWKIAIASNRPTVFTNLVLRKLNMKKYIDYVLCGDRASQLKPDPEIIYRILQRFKLRPEAAIYIGDMVIDVETAKNAKVKSIAVATGSSTQRELKNAGPTYLVESLQNIRDILSFF